MCDLTYFNLGFRSDNVSNTLSEIKSKSIASSQLLKDAFSIITDCLITKENDVVISKLAPGKGYETKTIVPIRNRTLSWTRGFFNNSKLEKTFTVLFIKLKTKKVSLRKKLTMQLNFFPTLQIYVCQIVLNKLFQTTSSDYLWIFELKHLKSLNIFTNNF